MRPRRQPIGGEQQALSGRDGAGRARAGGRAPGRTRQSAAARASRAVAAGWPPAWPGCRRRTRRARTRAAAPRLPRPGPRAAGPPGARMALLFWGAAHTPGGSGGAVVGSGVAAHQGSWCAGHERVMHFTHTQHHSPARSFSLALARASEQRPSQARAGLRACQARRTRAGTHEAAACRCCRGGARQDGAEPQRGQVDAGRAQALERALAAPGGTKLLCRQPARWPRCPRRWPSN